MLRNITLCGNRNLCNNYSRRLADGRELIRCFLWPLAAKLRHDGEREITQLGQRVINQASNQPCASDSNRETGQIQVVGKKYAKPGVKGRIHKPAVLGLPEFSCGAEAFLGSNLVPVNQSEGFQKFLHRFRNKKVTNNLLLNLTPRMARSVATYLKRMCFVAIASLEVIVAHERHLFHRFPQSTF